MENDERTHRDKVLDILKDDLFDQDTEHFRLLEEMGYYDDSREMPELEHLPALD